MKRTIDLDPESERWLQELARDLDLKSEEEAMRALVRYVMDRAGSSQSLAKDIEQHLGPAVRSTEGVMGGDACIRNTRIPVWLLVSYKMQGLSDSELLANYPSLNASDLTSAWDYFAAHAEEILEQRRRHNEAA